MNDVLLIGRDLLQSLWGIILLFREKPVTLLADIEKMFLLVEVEVDDRNLFRVLWRKHDGQLQMMGLTITFFEQSHHQHVLILHFSSEEKTQRLGGPQSGFVKLLYG